MPNKPITVKRWEVVAAFVLLTAVFTVSLVWIQSESASIADLQRTNCGLVQFLQTAREARLRSAERETGARRVADLRAAAGYQDLASRFRGRAIGRCAVAKR